MQTPHSAPNEGPIALVNSGSCQRTAEGSRNTIMDLLLTGNPFYLISSACVIHGTGFWFNASENQNPWALTALLAVFIAFLAAAGFCVVRFGKLWNDARTIFVMLLLLFVELALSFDSTLVSNPKDGILLIACGYLLTVLVFEVLVRTLKIRLGPLFRIPLHAMIGLLFLFPVIMLPAIRGSQHVRIQWFLCSYNMLVAFAVLLFLPAARRGHSYCSQNGTPWTWAIFPWAPVWVLTAALGVRSCVMCITLDPAILQSVSAARQLQSIFSTWFGVPILLAVAIVLLETGRSYQSRKLRTAAMILPGVAVLLAVGPFNSSVLQTAFAYRLQTMVASPLFLSLMGVLAFYAIGRVRRIPFADIGLSATLLLLTRIGPQTMRFDALIAWQAWPFAILTAVHLTAFLQGRNPIRLMLSLAALLPAIHLLAVPYVQSELLIWNELHVIVAICVIAGVVLRNSLFLRLSAAGMTSFAIAEICEMPPASDSFPVVRLWYVAGLMVMSAGLVVYRKEWSFSAPFTTATACFLWMVWERVREQLMRIQGWQGLLFYAAGIAWFAVAVAMSAWKTQRDRKKLSGKQR